MMDIYQTYQLTIWAAGLSGVMLLVQLGVADVAAIRSGHKAGTPIAADFERFLFRSARAHANMNESIAALTLFCVVGILSSASPTWLGGFVWLYLAARAAHMVAYYANKKTPRSTAFGVSLVALVGMFATIVVSWTG